MPINVFVGIDPGWKSLGYCLIQQDTETEIITVLNSKVFNMSSYESITAGVLAITALFQEFRPKNSVFKQLTMERFISYKNVDSAEFEIINRIIGAIDIFFNEAHSPGLPTRLERAIDWKTSLVKALHMVRGFENPSDKLDKKFSIAAAKACVDEDLHFKENHTADALCLACMPIYVPKQLKGK
jgi:hypothetical protein